MARSFTSSRSATANFSSAATRVWTIWPNILAFKLTPKESTPSADLFLPAWGMCRLPERNSRSPALRSPSVAPRARESKKSCWRKPQTHSRRRHDGRDHHHCLLLDHFVFLQWNRKRPAVDRYGAVAAKRKAARAHGFEIEPPAKAARTVTGDRFARHE